MTVSDHFGWDFLAEHGLNLSAVLATAHFSDELKRHFEESGIDLGDYSRLVLLGNGGGRLWEAMEEQGWRSADPVDDYSIEIAERWVDMVLCGRRKLRLYPQTDCLIPLQQLGMLANWGHRSPLGSHVSAKYGPWFAYRVAFLTDADFLPFKREEAQRSACDLCVEKPCISACPVGAVQGIGRLQLKRCLSHRLTAGASCEDRCMARLACPVGENYRYPLAQIQHHYTFGKALLKRYV